MEIINKMAENNETMRLQYAVYPADNIQITTDYERWSYNIFNNMCYGNCITMNSLHYNSKFDLGQVNGLTYCNKIPLFCNGKGEQKDAISKYQVMIIHQPVFDLSNIIRLPVSVETYVAVTEMDIKHEQNCISRDNYMTLNNSSKELNSEQHYLYTMEACMTNCLQI
ncbi:hypothetical protein CHUAL_011998 [Chamberlinius hualienensis]